MRHPQAGRVIAALLAILATGCASTAPITVATAPQTQPAPSGETLLAAPPEGWTQTGGTQSVLLRLAEFVPAADLEANPEVARGNWKEKITLERLQGQPVPDPLEFLEGLRADHLAGCSRGSYTPIAAAEENGYPSAVAMLSCPKLSLTDAGQITLIKVIQGDDAFYTVTRSVRVAPWLTTTEDDAGDKQAADDAVEGAAGDQAKAAGPAIEPSAIGGMSLWLRAIRVCNDATAEHPCTLPAAAPAP